MLPNEVIELDPIAICSEGTLQEEAALHLSDSSAEMSIAQISTETGHASFYEQPQETVITNEMAHSALSHEHSDFPIAQHSLEKTSLPMPAEAGREDETVHNLMEPVEIPTAQIPVEATSFAYMHESQFAFEHETLQSSGYEFAEMPVEPNYLEPVREETAETLVAHLEIEETKPQAPTEDTSLSYIHQNLAHILNMESYVMSALQNLDERSAEDMQSIRNLAKHTASLQQEFMYVRGVLNDLTKLPEQIEALKEQVLSQPQFSPSYSDRTEQEHLTIVGNRFNSVDAVLLQSVVTLDRLEEIQAGLGETIHTSSGQLSDRLTAIERRFEAIIVRPPDPVPVSNPVPVVSSTKSYLSPLLYMTIALGALNLGAMVALLLR
jgi:hypothetical protein